MPREIKPLGTNGKITTRQLPGGSWEADTRIRDYDGKTRRVRARGTTAYKAERNLKEKLLNRTPEQRANTINPHTRVNELGTIWFEEFRQDNDTANTLKRYSEALEYIKGRMSGVLVRECTPGLITNVLNGIKRERGYSSAKQSKTVLSNMFKLAVQHEAISSNPVRDALLKRDRGSSRKAVDALTLDEVHEVLSVLKGDVLAAAQVMLGTGGRIGEVLALRWQDVDLTPGRSAISFTGTYAQKFGDQPAGRQERTKSDSSNRTVFIPDELAQLLQARALHHIPTYAKTTDWAKPEAFIFPSSVGSMLDPNNYRSRFREQVKAANLGRTITPHIFRKTVATLVSREDSLTAASQLLGHSSEKITEDYYIQKLTEQPNASKTLGVFFEHTQM